MLLLQPCFSYVFRADTPAVSEFRFRWAKSSDWDQECSNFKPAKCLSAHPKQIALNSGWRGCGGCQTTQHCGLTTCCMWCLRVSHAIFISAWYWFSSPSHCYTKVFLDIVYRNREQASIRMRHSEVLCSFKYPITLGFSDTVRLVGGFSETSTGCRPLCPEASWKSGTSSGDTYLVVFWGM